MFEFIWKKKRKEGQNQADEKWNQFHRKKSGQEKAENEVHNESNLGESINKILSWNKLNLKTIITIN